MYICLQILFEFNSYFNSFGTIIYFYLINVFIFKQISFSKIFVYLYFYVFFILLQNYNLYLI